MTKVTVLRPFYDLVARCDRKEGEAFEATEERADQIASALPGYVTVQKDEGPDLSKMTAAELGELARERGIKLKGRQSKAALIAALSEE